MELLYFVLACYGLTFVLVYGSIFHSIRPEKNPEKMWTWLFHCPLCMGFWVGCFLFLINGGTELFTFDYTIANFFICGFISAGTSYALSMVFGDEGINIYHT